MEEFYNKATRQKFHTNRKLTNTASTKRDHIKHVSKVQNMQREKSNFEHCALSLAGHPIKSGIYTCLTNGLIQKDIIAHHFP